MNEMNNKIEKFRLNTMLLVREYPDYEDQISKSSTVIYINWRPQLGISFELENKELINRIESIYKNIFTSF